jgi:cytoskeletal protein RodZ
LHRHPEVESGRRLELPEVRQKRGLSLKDIADSTKISGRFLRAIEDEEFSQLPGGIFNTSYLRQYAAAVGYDEVKLLAYYRLTFGDSGVESEPQRRRRGFLSRLTSRG